MKQQQGDGECTAYLHDRHGLSQDQYSDPQSDSNLPAGHRASSHGKSDKLTAWIGWVLTARVDRDVPKLLTRRLQ